MKVSLPRTYTSPRGHGARRPRLALSGFVLVLLLLTAGTAAAQDNEPLFDDEMTIIFNELGVTEIDCPVEMHPSLLNVRCALFAPGDDYELFRNSFDFAVRQFSERFEVVVPWSVQGGSYLKGLRDTESPFTLLVAYAMNDTGFVALAGALQ